MEIKKYKRKLIVLIIIFIIIFFLYWISPIFTSCIECDWLRCRDCTNYRIAEKVVLIVFICSSLLLTALIIRTILKIKSIKNKGDDKL